MNEMKSVHAYFYWTVFDYFQLPFNRIHDSIQNTSTKSLYIMYIPLRLQLILQYLARFCCPCDFNRFPQSPTGDRSVTVPLSDGVRHRGENAEANVPVNVRKWRCIGTVLDRLFFTGFLVCLICTFVLTFPKPENMLYILS